MALPAQWSNSRRPEVLNEMHNPKLSIEIDHVNRKRQPECMYSTGGNHPYALIRAKPHLSQQPTQPGQECIGRRHTQIDERLPCDVECVPNCAHTCRPSLLKSSSLLVSVPITSARRPYPV